MEAPEVNSPMQLATEYNLLVTGKWLDAKKALDDLNPEDVYNDSKIRLLRHIILVHCLTNHMTRYMHC